MPTPLAPARVRRTLDLARSGPWFAALLLVALVAFWPSYLSRLGQSSAYTHLHAVLATLWIGLLVVQPWLKARRKLGAHRMLGRASYLLAPLMVVAVLLLAHQNLSGLEGEAFGRQSYVLYLQLSLAGLFALCWTAAILTRRTMALHARFMVATAFPLIDPVVVRLLLWADPTPAWNYQWATFALTDLVILTLIWLERDAPRGRWVFPTLLVVFVLAQLPALLGLTDAGPWQAFAGWYQGLPLT